MSFESPWDSSWLHIVQIPPPTPPTSSCALYSAGDNDTLRCNVLTITVNLVCLKFAFLVRYTVLLTKVSTLTILP